MSNSPVPVVLVVGGGVNGLSVAWGLAVRGRGRRRASTRAASAAAPPGIAGGIVRNYYRAEAITELVRLSVEMFEEDPEAYGFRQVGYLAAVPSEQVEDLVAIRCAARAGRATSRSWSSAPRPAAST